MNSKDTPEHQIGNQATPAASEAGETPDTNTCSPDGTGNPDLQPAEEVENLDLGYTVGYKRPPAHTRFRQGQSGNPRGRPRGSKSLKSILQNELDRRINITENGKRKKVSVSEALVKKQIAKALGDSDRARDKLFDMVLRHALDGDGQASATSSGDEEKFLALMKAIASQPEGAGS